MEKVVSILEDKEWRCQSLGGIIHIYCEVTCNDIKTWKESSMNEKVGRHQKQGQNYGNTEGHKPRLQPLQTW